MHHTELPEKIRFIRRALDKKQHDMAGYLGISQEAYSRIERGKTNISLLRLQQIAAAFGVSATQLIELPAKEIYAHISHSMGEPT